MFIQLRGAGTGGGRTGTGKPSIPDYNIEKKLHTAEFIDIAEDHGLIYDNFNNTNILIFDAEELLM